MKEFLSARAVDFESIDVANDPVGAAQLRRSGLRGLPVVAHNGEFVFGQDLAQVAQLLGLSYEARPALDAAMLGKRLETVLTAALRFAAQIPAERLHDKLPHRDRSYLTLANHIAQIPADFIAVINGAELRGPLAASLPEVNQSVAQLQQQAAATMTTLGNGLRDIDNDRLQGEIVTYFGKQTLHQGLERCVWHVAQHARQLMMVLEMLQIEPEQPLTARDFANLPMPQQVWDG